MIKIWLDDTRDPLTYGQDFKIPDRALKVLLKYGREGWVWVTNVADAKIALIQGNIFVLSCDNSLGSGLVEGYTLLDWLEEKAALEPTFSMPTHIYVHSSDSNRVVSMQQTIESIRRFQNRN